MGIFEWFKAYNDNIKQVENKLVKDGNDIIEIYHKNKALEEEIQLRTKELKQANQTLLTLENVWDMMNSSKPLSSVLEAIVQSLQDEFGYVYSCILQKQKDEDGDFFAYKTFLHNEFTEQIDNFLDEPFYSKKILINPAGELSHIINGTKGSRIYKFENIIEEVFPGITPSAVQDIKKLTKTKCFIARPIYSAKELYGSLMVFSPRPEPKENELNFLNIFGRQIELAITISNLFDTVKKQAVTDALTGLFNRRFYEDAISREASRALRLKQPFTLISLDLDHLKQINDTYGHTTGDKAIVAISKAISDNARSIDIPSRVGGEEFSIILPGIDAAGGMIAAERLRKTIEETYVEGPEHVTASIGVATFIEHTADIDELIEMADRATYYAKHNGRNQVKLAQSTSEISWQEIAVEAFVEILEKHRIPFDEEIAKKLTTKLKSKNTKAGSTSTKDILFKVADTIYSFGKVHYQKGTMQDKLNLATSIAKKLSLSKSEVDKLKVAILLYDIGTMALPQELLNKKGELTEEERNLITTHPVIAAQEILKPISTISDIIPIIEQHHENWDGTGYPFNLKGEDIPVTSQIILIVDSFYAMLSERPYRKALSPSEAIEEIKKSEGTKYSKELTSAFIDTVREEGLYDLY
ncbi:diguanylate cyclase [bacterium]|nr:diguanylate cyclase [bacterium]